MVPHPLTCARPAARRAASRAARLGAGALLCALCWSSALGAQPLPPPELAPLPSSFTYDLRLDHAQARAGALLQQRDALRLGAALGWGCGDAKASPCAALGGSTGLAREGLRLALPGLRLEDAELGWAGLGLWGALALWRWRGDGGARSAWIWTLDAADLFEGAAPSAATELRAWGPYHGAALRLAARPPKDDGPEGRWSVGAALWVRPCARAWGVCADGLLGLEREGDAHYARLGAGLVVARLGQPDEDAGLGLWVERWMGEDGAQGLPASLALRWRGLL